MKKIILYHRLYGHAITHFPSHPIMHSKLYISNRLPVPMHDLEEIIGTTVRSHECLREPLIFGRLCVRRTPPNAFQLHLYSVPPTIPHSHSFFIPILTPLLTPLLLLKLLQHHSPLPISSPSQRLFPLIYCWLAIMPIPHILNDRDNPAPV
jgi:hypothetical protein